MDKTTRHLARPLRHPIGRSLTLAALVASAMVICAPTASANIKQEARHVGHNVGRATHDVGQKFKHAGLTVGHEAKKVGLAIGHAAKTGGLAFWHAVKGH